MSWTIRTATTGLKAPPTVTSYSISKPTNTIQGDLMVLFLNASATAVLDAMNMTGWQNVEANTTNSNYFRVYWKLAGASEPTSYTWTGLPTGVLIGVLGAFRKNTGEPAFIKDAGQSIWAATSPQTVPAPSLTAITADSLVLTAFTFVQGLGAWTIDSVPAGETLLGTAAILGRALTTNYEVQAAAGATGVKNEVINYGNNIGYYTYSYTVAFNAAGSAATPTVQAYLI